MKMLWDAVQTGLGDMKGEWNVCGSGDVGMGVLMVKGSDAICASCGADFAGYDEVFECGDGAKDTNGEAGEDCVGAADEGCGEEGAGGDREGLSDSQARGCRSKGSADASSK